MPDLANFCEGRGCQASSLITKNRDLEAEIRKLRRRLRQANESLKQNIRAVVKDEMAKETE